jgi:hypothetical protein
MHFSSLLLPCAWLPDAQIIHQQDCGRLQNVILAEKDFLSFV